MVRRQGRNSHGLLGLELPDGPGLNSQSLGEVARLPCWRCRSPFGTMSPKARKVMRIKKLRPVLAAGLDCSASATSVSWAGPGVSAQLLLLVSREKGDEGLEPYCVRASASTRYADARSSGQVNHCTAK